MERSAWRQSIDLCLCLTSSLRDFTLKEASERMTLIRKLESDWALARRKKSYLWIQLSVGYLCPRVLKIAQKNGWPSPPD